MKVKGAGVQARSSATASSAGARGQDPTSHELHCRLSCSLCDADRLKGETWGGAAALMVVMALGMGQGCGGARRGIPAVGTGLLAGCWHQSLHLETCWLAVMVKLYCPGDVKAMALQLFAQLELLQCLLACWDGFVYVEVAARLESGLDKHKSSLGNAGFDVGLYGAMSQPS